MRPSKHKVSRRRFLASTGAALSVPWFVPATSLGLGGKTAPSDRITIAAIGSGGKGQHNTAQFLAMDDVQVLAVCDVDAIHASRGKQQVDDHYQNQDCQLTEDFREVIERDDVDAVHVSTPDHWHALATIAALRSGKDVYCEKPLANSVGEAMAIRDAAKKYNRMVQTGSHERSNDRARFACELIRNGRLGKVLEVEVNMPCEDEAHHQEVLNWKGIPNPESIPESLNWDMWLGHTPPLPYHHRRSHFWWRFILAFGGGEMTDRGAHIIDLAQLALGTDHTGPCEYQARGTQPENSLYDAFMDYEFELTYANGVRLKGRNQGPRGLKVVGAEGSIFIHVHGCALEANPVQLLDAPLVDGAVELGRSPGHHRNFIECIKSRKEPMAGAEIGCRTATICHLTNIAMRTGRKLVWDPEQEVLVGDSDASTWLTPTFRSPWEL